MTNLERIRKELSPARRKKVAARAARLIAEEMTLQELRRARKLTQVHMAKALGIGQDGVSKLEKRADLMISTLRKTVEAMGGSLSLVAEFPDRKPVVLSGIAEDEPRPRTGGGPTPTYSRPGGPARIAAWRGPAPGMASRLRSLSDHSPGGGPLAQSRHFRQTARYVPGVTPQLFSTSWMLVIWTIDRFLVAHDWQSMPLRRGATALAGRCARTPISE
jgi:transcriptional regulator with XRE-family HTH domain